MRTVLKYLKPYYFKMSVAMLFKFLEALFELALPFLMAFLIDNGIKAGNQRVIIIYSLIMLGLVASGFVFAVICQYMASRISLAFGKDIRRELFAHICELPQGQIDKYSASTLTNRLTNDIRDLQMGIAMFIRLFVRVPPIIVVSIILIFIINAKIGLVLLLFVPLVVTILTVMVKKNVAIVKSVQKSLDEISLASKESLEGAREIRIFSKQEKMRQRYYEKCHNYAALQRRSIAVSSLFSPLTTICINFAIAALLLMGGLQIASGGMQIGSLVAMISYLSLILTSLVTLSAVIIFYVKAITSSQRLSEIFHLAAEDLSGEKIEFAEKKPCISFDSVSFSYTGEGEDEIINQSFEIFDGDYIAIVGKTASGKTTVCNLIQKLYAATTGEICIYGKNINLISAEDICNFISRAEQKPSLLSGTIEQNVTGFTNEIDYERLEFALQASQSSEFVDKLQEKENYVLTKNANNLSGGQKQRLQIARTVYSQSKVKIFDDCFYALDDATQKLVFRSIEALPCTKIILTQRADYVKNADKIIVTNYGRIVAAGTYSELKGSCEKFDELL